jgi:hypothetical protein
MVDGDFSERHQALMVLAENREADRDLLENEAWDIIGGALGGKGRFSDDVRLLPDARPLLERLGSDEIPVEEQHETDLGRPLSAQITLATWGVILKAASGEPLDTATRQRTRHKLGELMLKTTDGKLSLDDLSHWDSQKMSEVALSATVQKLDYMVIQHRPGAIIRVVVNAMRLEARTRCSV